MNEGKSNNQIYSFLLETKNSGSLRFGAFLCFAGWLFFFVATIYLVLPPERTSISSPTMLAYAAMMILLGLSLLMGFLFFNSQIAFPDQAKKDSNKLSGLDVTALSSAILSGSISFFILIGLVNAYPVDSLPDSQFAVTIPLPEQNLTAKQLFSSKSENESITQSLEQLNGSKRHAVMFWTIDSIDSSPHDGLSKMFVACILVMGFGLIYPRLDSDSDDHKGVMQGLVIPLIGTVLFGAGAVEQADAEELRNDVKLLKHDLPPSRTILDGKREIYVTNVNELSPYGLKQIENSIKSLSMKFAKTKFSEKSDVSLVRGDLEMLRSELRSVQKAIDTIPNLNSVTLVDPDNDAIAALKRSIDSIHGQTKQVSQDTAKLTTDFASLNASQKSWFCALMRERIVTAETETRRWRVNAQNLDRDAERDFFENIVVGIVGESKRKNAASREIDYPINGNARFKQIMGACGLGSTEVGKVAE